MSPERPATRSAPEPMEIVSTRVFAVPRETLFGAFEYPQHLAHWWGPSGFTTTMKEFDFRPGGAWRFVLHGPDGTDYDNASDFIEIVRPEKIVFVHLRPMHRFQMTMTYVEVAPGKTKLTWHLVFEASPENERLRQFIVAANEQNFDRLAALLDKSTR